MPESHLYRGSWPTAADFAAPPSAADRARWHEAERAARPARLARLRDRFAPADLDGYFGVSAENARYLTGFALEDGEEKVAGDSGRHLVGATDVVLLADGRYAAQAAAEAPEARIEFCYGDLPARWLDLVASIGARRVAVEVQYVSHAVMLQLQNAAPEVELVPVEGWVEADRAVKDETEVERISAACAVADRALANLLSEITPGRTERELAMRLEWQIRTGGADHIAMGVACLAGERAAMPHGSPSDRPLRSGDVLLFDYGALVDGYRSDMSRTLFVGEPTSRDLEVYELVARAQATAIHALEAAAEEGQRPTGQAIDASARRVIADAGRGDSFPHGTGHGIGLALHEEPRVSKTGSRPLPSPTVFSVEPGVYLDGQTGVRIEDLVLFDAAGRCTRRLTCFPRDVVVVGAS